MDKKNEISFTENLRSMGKMAVVLSGHALFFLVPMTIVTAQPSMARAFAQQGWANGVFQAQLVVIVAALTSIIGAPAMPLAAKRIGKRPALLAMLLLYALSGSVGFFSGRFAVLLVSRGVLGFCGGAVASLTVALIPDYYGEALRARLLGFTSTIQMAAAFVAIALSGWLVDHFGWNSAFLVYPVIGFAAFLIAIFAITEPDIHPKLVSSGQTKTKFLRELAPVYGVYGLNLCLVIGFFMVPIQGPFLLASIGTVRAASQGLAIALPNLATMVAAFFFGTLFAIFQERRLVILTAAVMGLALIATAFSHNLVEVALCFVVLGLGGGMAIPLAFEMVIRRASVSFRGTAVGIQLSIVGIGQFLNPVFCEPINRQFGIKGGFIGAGCLVLALAIGLISGNFGTAEPGALSAVKDFDATEDFKHLI